jgi:hypothetical protein
MTAVSQSYHNYLGGLNEQPDELKKPGQLTEALNVITDPVVGLTRRPGFELIEWKDFNGIPIPKPDIDARGTWFEMARTNQINNDYMYFGCVDRDGNIQVFNQDGEQQKVRYTTASIDPHKTYTFKDGVFSVADENGKIIDTYEAVEDKPLSYFKHGSDKPLKYCVSKDHIIFTNPTTVPRLDGAKVPTNYDKKKYYSYINLKVLDTDNYNYIFKRFYGSNSTESYTYVTEIDIKEIENIIDDYDKDLSLPLQTNSPFILSQNPSGGGGEPLIFEINFTGQVVQLKSDDGDGYRNEARYSYDVSIVSPGKGFQKNQNYSETIPGVDGLPNLKVEFKIEAVRKTTGTTHDTIVPGSDGSISDWTLDQILAALKDGFEDVGIDKAVVVGNGLYLENSNEFSVSTTEIAVADVINSQKLDNDQVPLARINTVAELPVECYDGFIVQVVNSFDGKNDYYLEYTAESNTKDDVDITKADGFWEEIAKPFEKYNPENITLPHMITVVRQNISTRFVFVVSKIAYKKRTAGTALDNPSMFSDFSPISAVNFYKNRLFFMTMAGTAVASRADDISNFFLDTAINTSTIDPIDLIANSNQRVPIHGSAIVNNGMVMFGESEQYVLSTNSDLLTSETANVTKVSNYTFDPVSNPIYLGTNIGFISSGSSRFYEMTNVYDRGPIDINERSQQVEKQFGQGFNMPVSSREQSMMVVYKKYTQNNDQNRSDILYVYRFRQENSQESSQTSWVKWQVNKPVAYVSMPRDKMFVFVHKGSTGTDMYVMNTGNISDMNYTDGHTDDADGVPFTTRIKIPTIYPLSKDKADVAANVTIHRIKLSTADIGAYDVRIRRAGYDNYTILVEQTPSDEYQSNTDPIYYEDHVETIPVYTRNKDLSIIIETDYNAPMSLRSMTWEGDYNRPYYKSV